MQNRTLPALLFCISLLAAGYPANREETIPDSPERRDSATPLRITLDGSLQNGAWSPDAKAIVFTRFRGGYNRGPADLYTYSLSTKKLHLLVADGSDNVNLPGASWNPRTNKIVFSSSRGDHDEIFIIDRDGLPGEEAAITQSDSHMAYEPSFSPDGQWVVFESHPVDVETQGTITKHRLDNTVRYQALTAPSDDCRQPNWSPAGDKILYQKLTEGQWDIWVMNADGTEKRQLTNGPGNKTDASFSTDGQWVVYSAEHQSDYANLFLISVNGGPAIRVTDFDGYDGAPSWSRGGKILFESHPGDPDRTKGTTLWVIEAPRLAGMLPEEEASPIVD